MDKLQKRICRTGGPSLPASLEPLAHRRNVASLSLYYRHYFGSCSSELTELVPLPYSRGSSTAYSENCMIFLSPSLDVTRIPMSTVSFLAQLDPTNLTYDLNGLSLELTTSCNCRFCLNRFSVCFNLFVLLFLVTPYAS